MEQELLEEFKEPYNKLMAAFESLRNEIADNKDSKIKSLFEDNKIVSAGYNAEQARYWIRIEGQGMYISALYW